MVLIATDVNEEQLLNIFNEYGKVEQVNLKLDKLSQTPLGYAFITMSNHNEAMEAFNMDGGEINNKLVRIGWARRSTKNYMNSNYNNNRYNVMTNNYGYNNNHINNHSYHHYNNNNNINNYNSNHHHHDNGGAFHDMNHNNQQNHTNNGPPTTPVSLYVRFNTSIDVEMTDSMLMDIFKTFSKPTSAHIKSIADTNGVRHGYAFLHFSDDQSGRDNAHAACEAAKDVTVNGVHLNAELSKNLLRGERPDNGEEYPHGIYHNNTNSSYRHNNHNHNHNNLHSQSHANSYHHGVNQSTVQHPNGQIHPTPHQQHQLQLQQLAYNNMMMYANQTNVVSNDNVSIGHTNNITTPTTMYYQHLPSGEVIAIPASNNLTAQAQAQVAHVQNHSNEVNNHYDATTTPTGVVTRNQYQQHQPQQSQWLNAGNTTHQAASSAASGDAAQYTHLPNHNHDRVVNHSTVNHLHPNVHVQSHHNGGYVNQIQGHPAMIGYHNVGYGYNYHHPVLYGAAVIHANGQNVIYGRHRMRGGRGYHHRRRYNNHANHMHRPSHVYHHQHHHAHANAYNTIMNGMHIQAQQHNHDFVQAIDYAKLNDYLVNTNVNGNDADADGNADADTEADGDEIDEKVPYDEDSIGNDQVNEYNNIEVSVEVIDSSNHHVHENDNHVKSHNDNHTDQTDSENIESYSSHSPNFQNSHVHIVNDTSSPTGTSPINDPLTQKLRIHGDTSKRSPSHHAGEELN